MHITEQPGRIIAIAIVAPFLVYCALRINRYPSERSTAILLIAFAAVFFIYESAWLTLYPPKGMRLILERANSRPARPRRP